MLFGREESLKAIDPEVLVDLLESNAKKQNEVMEDSQ